MKRILPLIIAVFILCSCAARTAYYDNLNGLIAGGRFQEAAGLAEQSRDSIYGEKNAFLYCLDRATLLQLSGSYADSNVMFERAKRIAADHFTKSITTEASTLLVSDNMRPYYGEDFERALINVFSAVNYLMLGQESEALVEARQVDHYLTTLRVNYGFKNHYTEDAFARYLMGMIYENQGQINDAFISYRQALDAYRDYEKNFNVKTPSALAFDALRTARKLGFRDEMDAICRDWGITPPPAAGQTGELVILNCNGLSAEKIDSFFEIAFGKAWLYVNAVSVRGKDAEQVEQARSLARSVLFDDQIRVAFPEYVRTPYRIQGLKARLVSDAGAAVPADVVEDVSAIAEKTLADRITRVRVRAIARAAIKYALANKVSQQVENRSNNEALAWLAKKAMTVASTATEHADKRSWRSLPDKILMARMTLPPGKHSIDLSFYDQDGTPVESRTLNDVEIKTGKKTFVMLRTAK